MGLGGRVIAVERERAVYGRETFRLARIGKHAAVFFSGCSRFVMREVDRKRGLSNGFPQLPNVAAVLRHAEQTKVASEPGEAAMLCVYAKVVAFSSLFAAESRCHPRPMLSRQKHAKKNEQERVGGFANEARPMKTYPSRVTYPPRDRFL